MPYMYEYLRHLGLTEDSVFRDNPLNGIEKRAANYAQKLSLFLHLPVPLYEVIPTDNEVSSCAPAPDIYGSIAVTLGQRELLPNGQNLYAHEMGHLYTSFYNKGYKDSYKQYCEEISKDEIDVGEQMKRISMITLHHELVACLIGWKFGSLPNLDFSTMENPRNLAEEITLIQDRHSTVPRIIKNGMIGVEIRRGDKVTLEENSRDLGALMAYAIAATNNKDGGIQDSEYRDILLNDPLNTWRLTSGAIGYAGRRLLIGEKFLSLFRGGKSE